MSKVLKSFSKITKRASSIQAEIKDRAVYKMYWGRTSLYRLITHIFLFFLTFTTLLTGIYSRFSNSYSGTLVAGFLPVGNVDLVEQGGNIEVLSVKNPNIYFNVFDYTVLSGDTLDTIADKYSIKKDTIKWANPKVDYYSEVIIPGDVIRIPEINGVLYEVKEGDTLDTVAQKTSGDRFVIAELNYLEAPAYNLNPGSKILIPDGFLPPPPTPPPLIPYQNKWRVPTNIGANIFYASEYAGMPIVNPLSNPDCAGYIFSRGWAVYWDGFHNGLDLAKYGGCPIRAIASGTVISAGWNYWGGGYTVVVDHGAGLVSQYLHGETIWVSAGEYVSAGQEIMYMGTTGNSTGVHLHLTLKVNNVPVDPAIYIPY